MYVKTVNRGEDRVSLNSLYPLAVMCTLFLLFFQGMNKGYIYVNGVNLGRYWPTAIASGE